MAEDHDLVDSQVFLCPFSFLLERVTYNAAGEKNRKILQRKDEIYHYFLLKFRLLHIFL